MMVTSVLKSFLIVGVFAGFGTTSYTPKVDTKIGKIIGFQRSFKEGKVNFFFGIPYAQPPVGDLRFKKSIPYKGSNDVIKATDFAPICYQPRVEIIGADNPYGQSEDCLYLDIVQNADALKDGKKRPVLVINEALGLDFETEIPYVVVPQIYQIPLRYDIINVYVSSRRNIFGYAYSKDYPELKGNYALWDQNLALKWVQENIEYFGGDPKSVTILGVGPGSSEVGAHIISLYSKGLFQNAIMMGAAIATVGEDLNGETTLTTNIVIERVGCKDAKDVLDCLQKVPPKKFIDSLTLRRDPVTPVLKSDYLPNSLLDIITNSYFDEDLNLLIIYDKNAGSRLVAATTPQVWADVKFTYDQAYKIITSIFNKEYSNYIAQKYIGSKSDTYDDMRIRQGISDLFTDLLFACPLIEYGYRAAEKQKKGQTYVLINYYQPTTSVFEVCKDDPRLGVCEREFASLLTGDPFIFYDEFNNTDRKASAFAMELISSFVYSGSPTKGKLPSLNAEKGVKLVAGLFTPEKLIIDKSKVEFCHNNVYDFVKNTLDKFYPLDPAEKPEQAKLDAQSSFYGFLYDVYHYVSTQYYRL